MVDGEIGQPYGPHYEYLFGGPGDGDVWSLTAKNMVDAGLVPTQFDIDESYPTVLSIWSDAEEDYPFKIWIRGLDENGHEVRTNGAIGETVEFPYAADGTSGNAIKTTVSRFSRITQIVKAVGKGYIRISTTSPDGIPDRILTCMRPEETSPLYRRFKLHGVPTVDLEGFTLVKGLFRIGYAPVRNDNDPLAINIIHALKLMVKSVLLQEHEEPNKSAVLEGQVERILTNQASQYDVDDNLIDTDDNYGMEDARL
jgi:hypothetical protein